MRRKLAAGNWKMNGTRVSLTEVEKLAARPCAEAVDVLLCLPATLIAGASALVTGKALQIGAQDCHTQPDGAFTGDLGAPMLADAGATAVIVGHSERRSAYQETNATVCAKASAAHAAGLTALICLGESMRERDAGDTLDIIGEQIDASVPRAATPATTVIAYEPVWAIGSGRTAQPDQIAEVHDFMRRRLMQRFGEQAGMAFRLLYGGSVKPENADGIFAVPNVDGALVGGASLTAAAFSPVVSALEASTQGSTPPSPHT